MQTQHSGVVYKHDQTQKKKQSPSCLQRTSSVIQTFLENVFYRLGCIIGKYPFPTLLISLLLTGVFGAGLVYFYEETQPDNLWVPADSVAQDHRKWIDDNYPPDFLRFQSMIIEADNVLDPSVLSMIYDMDQKVKAIDEGDGMNWENMCARLGSECWSNSVLEMWSFDFAAITELTSDDILDSVNTVVMSPMYQVKFDVSRYLGGLTRDSQGNIVSAKAAYLRYVIQSNDSIRNELGEGNKKARQFEEGFLRMGESGHSGVKAVYYNAERSRTDIGSGAIFGDLSLLFAGFGLIFVFVAVVLGKFNMVHHRIFLAVAGVMCVGFAALVSIGFASYANVFFGPLHNILPFLLLGIGVDDMFVIVQAWEVTKEESVDLPLHERMGRMMKNAGVSITVTSLTDILAFGIGATTKIPALRSFCIYACIGIFAVYLYQATFFVACLTLDNRRAGALRNACCCCYVHNNYEPNPCSEQEFVQGFFDRWLGWFLTRVPVKVAVLIIAAGLFAPAVYGVTQLEQDFDPDWFIPSDTYLADYLDASKKFFPDASAGIPGHVYLGEIDYFAAFPKLVQLHEDMESSDTIQTGTILSWYYFFDQWLQTSGHIASSESEFYSSLSIFLYGDSAVTSQAGAGATFIRDIVFNDTNITNPRHIMVSKVQYEHSSLEDAAAEIAAMDDLRSLVSALDIENVFPYSFYYLIWEGNKVIREELFRNIGLAFLCVFIMTLLLIAHPWTCTLVCVCVIATLVDVGGLVYYWGLTIDTVTSINLILAVGLAVDYAAHIGHTFMTVHGNRNERTKATISRMGPAVFYGGFSTFLAFILLAGSTSYVFGVFFRVFFGVVLFGLFHGLLFLPVLLSLVGPAPYLSPQEMKGKESKSIQHGQFDGVPQQHDAPARGNVPIFEGSMLGSGTINSGFLGDGTPNTNYAAKTNSPGQTEDIRVHEQPLPWMFYQGKAKQQPAATHSLPTQKQHWPGRGASTPQPVHWNTYQPYGFSMPSPQARWNMPHVRPVSNNGKVMTPGHPHSKQSRKRKNSKKLMVQNDVAGYYGNGYYPEMANNAYSMSLDRYYQ